LKRTPETNPDYKDLNEVLIKLKNILQQINEKAGKAQNNLKLNLLNYQLIFNSGEWYDLKLTAPERKLIREGTFNIKIQGYESELTVFLFDHMLVLAKRKKNGLYKVFRTPIPLETLIINDKALHQRRASSIFNSKSNSDRNSITSLKSNSSTNLTSLQYQDINKYPLILVQLGRSGGMYVLYAMSFADRKAWKDAIEKQRAIVQEKMKIYDIVSLGTSSCFTLSNRVNCVLPFNENLVVGSENGLYIGPADGSGNFEKILNLPKINQIDILPDLEFFVILSDKSVYVYSSSIFNRGDGTATSIENEKKLCSNINFFKVGLCLGRYLIACVKSTNSSSTIQTFEYTHSQSSKNRRLMKLLKSNNSKDRLKSFKEFYVQDECNSIYYLRSKICIAGSKTFQVIDMETLLTQDLLDFSDPSFEFMKRKDLVIKPISIFRTMNDYYILCFSNFALFIDRLGRRARPNKMIYWLGVPTVFTVQHQYLFAFDPEFVEIRSLESCEIVQIIPCHKLKNLNKNTLHCVMEAQTPYQIIFRLVSHFNGGGSTQSINNSPALSLKSVNSYQSLNSLNGSMTPLNKLGDSSNNVANGNTNTKSNYQGTTNHARPDSIKTVSSSPLIQEVHIHTSPRINHSKRSTETLHSPDSFTSESSAGNIYFSASPRSPRSPYTSKSPLINSVQILDRSGESHSSKPRSLNSVENFNYNNVNYPIDSTINKARGRAPSISSSLKNEIKETDNVIKENQSPLYKQNNSSTSSLPLSTINKPLPNIEESRENTVTTTPPTPPSSTESPDSKLKEEMELSIQYLLSSPDIDLSIELPTATFSLEQIATEVTEKMTTPKEENKDDEESSDENDDLLFSRSYTKSQIISPSTQSSYSSSTSSSSSSSSSSTSPNSSMTSPTSTTSSSSSYYNNTKTNLIPKMEEKDQPTYETKQEKDDFEKEKCNISPLDNMKTPTLKAVKQIKNNNIVLSEVVSSNNSTPTFTPATPTKIKSDANSSFSCDTKTPTLKSSVPTYNNLDKNEHKTVVPPKNPLTPSLSASINKELPKLPTSSPSIKESKTGKIKNKIFSHKRKFSKSLSKKLTMLPLTKKEPSSSPEIKKEFCPSSDVKKETSPSLDTKKDTSFVTVTDSLTEISFDIEPITRPVTESKNSPVFEHKISPISDHKISPISDHKISPISDNKISPISEHKISPVTEHKISPVTEPKNEEKVEEKDTAEGETKKNIPPKINVYLPNATSPSASSSARSGGTPSYRPMSSMNLLNSIINENSDILSDTSVGTTSIYSENKSTVTATTDADSDDSDDSDDSSDIENGISAAGFSVSSDDQPLQQIQMKLLQHKQQLDATTVTSVSSDDQPLQQVQLKLLRRHQMGAGSSVSSDEQPLQQVQLKLLKKNQQEQNLPEMDLQQLIQQQQFIQKQLHQQQLQYLQQQQQQPLKLLPDNISIFNSSYDSRRQASFDSRRQTSFDSRQQASIDSHQQASFDIQPQTSFDVYPQTTYDSRRKSSAVLRYSISSVSSIGSEFDEDDQFSEGILDLSMNSSSLPKNLTNSESLKQNIMSEKQNVLSENHSNPSFNNSHVKYLYRRNNNSNSNSNINNNNNNININTSYNERIQPISNEISISIPTTISSEEPKLSTDEYYLQPNDNILKETKINPSTQEKEKEQPPNAPYFTVSSPDSSKTEIETTLSNDTVISLENNERKVKEEEEKGNYNENPHLYVNSKRLNSYENEPKVETENSNNKSNSFEPLSLSLSLDIPQFTLSISSLDLASSPNTKKPTVLPSKTNISIPERKSSFDYSMDNIQKQFPLDESLPIISERERSNSLPSNLLRSKSSTVATSKTRMSSPRDIKGATTKKTYLSQPVLPEIASLSPVNTTSLLSELEDLAKHQFLFKYDSSIDNENNTSSEKKQNNHSSKITSNKSRKSEHDVNDNDNDSDSDSDSFVIPNLPDIPMPLAQPFAKANKLANINTDVSMNVPRYSMSDVLPTRPSSISSISPNLKEGSPLSLYANFEETTLKPTVYPTEFSPKLKHTTSNSYMFTGLKKRSENKSPLESKYQQY